MSVSRFAALGVVCARRGGLVPSVVSRTTQSDPIRLAPLPGRGAAPLLRGRKMLRMIETRGGLAKSAVFLAEALYACFSRL